MSPLPPRIAVVGGGLAGSLCSLVLRMRGARPVVIDAGCGSLGHGGALPDSGTQFLRAVDPRLRSMLAMLEREGLVAPWVGRFGVLGSSGGGFLPAVVVAATKLGAATAPSADGGFAAYTDGGDFCGFINELAGPDAMAPLWPTFVGTPSMAALCGGILAKAKVEVWAGRTVADASFAPGRDGGWRLKLSNSSGSGGGSEDAGLFDGLVLCADDPSLAARVVHGLAADLRVNSNSNSNNTSNSSSSSSSSSDDNSSNSSSNSDDNSSSDSGSSSKDTRNNGSEAEWEVLAAGRLEELATRLRVLHKRPLFVLSALYPAVSSSLEAATVPGSPVLQFLARDASKPGRPARRPAWPQAAAVPGAEGELWTAVSTAAFAEQVLAQFPTLVAAAHGGSGSNADGSAAATASASARLREAASAAASGPMEAELRRLLGLAAGAGTQGPSGQGPTPTPDPLGAALATTATFWPRALRSTNGLDLDEDAIALEPWRFAIAGDFVRTPRQAARPRPASDDGEATTAGGGKSEPAGPATPAEAAAVSGLEAGERVAAFFAS